MQNKYVPNQQRDLGAFEVNGRLADVDTKAKILEQIFDETTEASEGIIRLFTKFPVWDSCGGVIEKFVNERLGIKIEVIEGI